VGEVQNSGIEISINTVNIKSKKFTWLQPQEKFINTTKHLLGFFDYLDDDQLLNEHKSIQNLISMIDLSTFIGWSNWFITELTSSYPCGPGGHILENGHQAVANKVLEYYNRTS
jgi:hypothetical protein